MLHITTFYNYLILRYAKNYATHSCCPIGGALVTHVKCKITIALASTKKLLQSFSFMFIYSFLCFGGLVSTL